MKPYINFNTRKRKEATNEADKNHFKLLNKAVYGKTIENMRKRIKIIVVKNAKDFIKYTSRPTCVNWKVFENNLAAVHEKKIPLTLNKWEMFNFHYNFLIRKFDTRLLFKTQAVYVINFMKKIHIKKCTSTKNYLI